MNISEVILLASDLDAQRHFYHEMLHLPVVGDWDGHRLTLQAGSSRLTFTQAAAEWKGSYHFAFNIPSNQFGQAKTWLSRRVSLFVDADGADEFAFTSWNADGMYFSDPSGNIVEFIARHDLPNSTDEPFGERGILSVSEIGVVTDDVNKTVAEARMALGAHVYRGEGSDTFAPVGDENGLLIIVKRGRIWFPDTGVIAESLPLTASLSGDGGEPFQLSGPPLRIAPARG